MGEVIDICSRDYGKREALLDILAKPREPGSMLPQLPPGYTIGEFEGIWLFAIHGDWHDEPEYDFPQYSREAIVRLTWSHFLDTCFLIGLEWERFLAKQVGL